ncbi:MAG: DAK2 domain-containing protein [Ferrimicrobium sp.]
MELGPRTGCRVIATGLRNAAAALERLQGPINQLNVFPVPDGDTGTNMFRTLRAGVDALDELPGVGCDPSVFVHQIGRATLLGARGNSGVILSQILHDLIDHLVTQAPLEESWEGALTSGSNAARAAVLNPKEGTMLTVIQEAARGAKRGVVASLIEARTALERTPTQLEVLAKAGVVDSGGAGLVVVLEELAFACGVVFDQAGEYPWLSDTANLPDASLPDLSTMELESDGEEDLRYEVMYVLEASAATVDGFRQVWSGLGDSIVIVGHGELFRCHIHTNEIGASIEAGIEAGRVSSISVTDLLDQVDELSWVTEGAQTGQDDEAHHRETAVVAVGVGSGISRLFRSFGVTAIVAGGHGLNPSTAELLRAVEAQNATGVLVLPNNSNIQAAASAVPSLASRPTVIVPTVHVIEGFSALMAYDPSSDLASNVTRMTEAARHVRWGELTIAVRTGSWAGGSFDVGDWIGLAAEGIVAAGGDLTKALSNLVGHLVSEESEIVTIIEGERAEGTATEAVVAWIGEHFKDCEVEVLVGDQPLYPYLCGVE